MLDFSGFAGRTVRAAGLGEVLFDVYASGPRLGGAPANFAFHCAENGLKAAVISSVGDDELGEKAREQLSPRFLPALLLPNDRQTGFVKVEVDARGVPSYSFADDTAYDNIPLADSALELVRSLDLICFGTLAQRGEVSRRTIMALLDAMPEGSLRVFDVNLRGEYYSREVIEDSLRRTDVFKCNEESCRSSAAWKDLGAVIRTDSMSSSGKGASSASFAPRERDRAQCGSTVISRSCQRRRLRSLTP